MFRNIFREKTIYLQTFVVDGLPKLNAVLFICSLIKFQIFGCCSKQSSGILVDLVEPPSLNKPIYLKKKKLKKIAAENKISRFQVLKYLIIPQLPQIQNGNRNTFKIITLKD